LAAFGPRLDTNGDEMLLLSATFPWNGIGWLGVMTVAPGASWARLLRKAVWAGRLVPSGFQELVNFGRYRLFQTVGMKLSGATRAFLPQSEKLLSFPPAKPW
jgi:hypothetical protein